MCREPLADLLFRLYDWTESPVRLVFFPHAGSGHLGYSRFLERVADLAQVWVFDAPGRERRIEERPVAQLSYLAESAVFQLSMLPMMPTVLFGISFGALVAHEIARRAYGNGLCRTLKLLIVASAPAPCRHSRFPAFAHLPGPQMLQAVHDRFGAPGIKGMESSDFFGAFTPALRADLAMWESYVPAQNSSVSVPLRIWTGRDDVYTSEDFQAWINHYPVAAPVRVFSGNHFFIQQCLPDAVEGLRLELVSIASSC